MKKVITSLLAAYQRFVATRKSPTPPKGAVYTGRKPGTTIFVEKPELAVVIRRAFYEAFGRGEIEIIG
jgi:hypothetical protein